MKVKLRYSNYILKGEITCPYICIIKKSHKKFIPRIIDFHSKVVWNQKLNNEGSWYDFYELIFKSKNGELIL